MTKPIQGVPSSGYEQPDTEGAAQEEAVKRIQAQAPPTNGRVIIRFPEVKKRVPKSRVQIWRDVRDGKFPAPVSLGPNAIGWFEDEIDAYQASLPRVGQS